MLQSSFETCPIRYPPPIKLISAHLCPSSSFIMTQECKSPEQSNLITFILSQTLTFSIGLVVLSLSSPPLQGALGNSFYLVEEERFPSVSLTHGMISESLYSAGLSEVRWHHISRQCPLDKMADHTGCFFVLARKAK